MSKDGRRRQLRVVPDFPRGEEPKAAALIHQVSLTFAAGGANHEYYLNEHQPLREWATQRG